jgi:copper homeostasis protein
MALEIACFNIQSVLVAAKGGANRIELCANQYVGGTTPSTTEFIQIKKAVPFIPINVMIRPRGSNFEYSEEEFAQMEMDLGTFHGLGANGFVFGILKEGAVDVERCGHLVRLAEDRPCTFHRAFDELEDMDTGLKDVAKCGFQAVLTSAGKHDAIFGMDRLGELVGNEVHVTVIVGGGVRASNIEILKAKTGAKWFHSSALVGGENVASLVEVQAMRRL